MEDIYDAHVRNEHPVKQRIQSVTLAQGEGAFTVGAGNVTLIEPTVKSGPYSHIPYIRVWAGEDCVAEICQHNLHSVFFFPPEPSHD